MKLYIDYSELKGSDLFIFFYNIYMIKVKMNWCPNEVIDNYGVVNSNNLIVEIDLIESIQQLVSDKGDLIESIWNLIDRNLLLAIKADNNIEQTFIKTQLFDLNSWEPPREKKELRVRIIK